jgi:hypothetical protein
MPAAIRPYSMAVAPDSSFTKRDKMLFMTRLLKVHTWLSELTQRFIFAVWIVVAKLFPRNFDGVKSIDETPYQSPNLRCS